MLLYLTKISKEEYLTKVILLNDSRIPIVEKVRIKKASKKNQTFQDSQKQRKLHVYRNKND